MLAFGTILYFKNYRSFLRNSIIHWNRINFVCSFSSFYYFNVLFLSFSASLLMVFEIKNKKFKSYRKTIRNYYSSIKLITIITKSYKRNERKNKRRTKNYLKKINGIIIEIIKILKITKVV